jgi:hypothetical protein
MVLYADFEGLFKTCLTDIIPVEDPYLKFPTLRGLNIALQIVWTGARSRYPNGPIFSVLVDLKSQKQIVLMYKLLLFFLLLTTSIKADGARLF